MSTIIIVIICLVCIWVILFYVLPHVIAVFENDHHVRSVTLDEPRRFGQIRIIQNSLQIRRLTIKNIPVADVELVEGYLMTTAGLEDVSCVDLTLSNGNKICFDGSDKEHQELIDQVLLILGVTPVNWVSQFGPFSYDRLIIYKK